MIPVETVTGIRGVCGGEQWRGKFNMTYLIHFKNLCKCYNVPTSSTTIIKKYLCEIEKNK
jgi:hypothetical protein